MNASFINCCAVPLHYITHSFCPATLNGVLGTCLQKSKFYKGVPELPGTPPPYAPALDYRYGSLKHFANGKVWVGTNNQVHDAPLSQLHNTE